MTPRVIHLVIAGKVRAIERTIRLQRRLEWHMLAPHGGKNFPSLERFMRSDDAKSGPDQTPDEIAATMARYAVGGGITRTYPPGHPNHKP